MAMNGTHYFLNTYNTYSRTVSCLKSGISLPTNAALFSEHSSILLLAYFVVVEGAIIYVGQSALILTLHRHIIFYLPSAEKQYLIEGLFVRSRGPLIHQNEYDPTVDDAIFSGNVCLVTVGLAVRDNQRCKCFIRSCTEYAKPAESKLVSIGSPTEKLS